MDREAALQWILNLIKTNKLAAKIDEVTRYVLREAPAEGCHGHRCRSAPFTCMCATRRT